MRLLPLTLLLASCSHEPIPALRWQDVKWDIEFNLKQGTTPPEKILLWGYPFDVVDDPHWEERRKKALDENRNLFP